MSCPNMKVAAVILSVTQAYVFWNRLPCIKSIVELRALPEEFKPNTSLFCFQIGFFGCQRLRVGDGA